MNCFMYHSRIDFPDHRLQGNSLNHPKLPRALRNLHGPGGWGGSVTGRGSQATCVEIVRFPYRYADHRQRRIAMFQMRIRRVERPSVIFMPIADGLNLCFNRGRWDGGRESPTSLARIREGGFMFTRGIHRYVMRTRSASKGNCHARY